MDEAPQLIESIFRAEHGRIIATLIRQSGSFQIAEDAMQDAFASAMAHWPNTGLPANPAAWITACARRKVTDAFRRSNTRTAKQRKFDSRCMTGRVRNPAGKTSMMQ